MDYHEKKIKDALGEESHKPWVSFFDKAVPDPIASEDSGRPRFQERVYIQKIPSAPDLPVRDIFTRLKEEEDEREWPREWQAYLDRKQEIDNLDPPVRVLPGMGVAPEAELKALGIVTCKQMVEYDKPLDELEPLRDIARQVLEIADALRKERSGVRAATEPTGPVYSGATVPGDGGRGFSKGKPAALRFVEEEGDEEKGQKESVQTFHYEIVGL